MQPRAPKIVLRAPWRGGRSGWLRRWLLLGWLALLLALPAAALATEPLETATPTPAPAEPATAQETPLAATVEPWASALLGAPSAPGRPINEYPGSLRLPRRDHPLLRDQAVQSASFSLRPTMAGPTPFYQVLLGDQTPAEGPLARVFGASGAALFPTFGGGPDRPDGCPDEAAYCQSSHFGLGGPPTMETFFELRSAGRGDRARLTHSIVNGNHQWVVLVYDARADETLGLSLHERLADRAGPRSLDSANTAAAQQLVDLVSDFERVTLPRPPEPSSRG